MSVLLAGTGIAYTLQALTFKTSGRDLLPRDAGYVVRYNQYARDFGELEDIVVVIEAQTFEAAKAYAARLVQELRASPLTFQRVAYRVDPQRFEGRQLLYLPTEQLKEIRDRIFDHQEFMESFAGDPSLARLIEGVNTAMAAAFVTNLFDLGLDNGLPVDTRFLHMVLEQIGGRLERPAPYRSPWGTLFSFGRGSPTRATSSPTTRACSSSWWRRRRATRAASWATRSPSRPSATPSPGCAELPHRAGGRDGRARALQRRDVGGLPRQRGRHRDRLRAHPARDGAAFRRVGKLISC